MRAFFRALPSQLRRIWAGAKSVRRLNLSTLRKVFSLMGKKEKIVLVALLGLAAMGLLWSAKNLYYAASVPAPSFGGAYTEGFLGQPNYLNPVLAFQENDWAIIRLIYSGLYKYDGQGNLIPDLAESAPQISPDQKQYTIKLRRNVQWHNGRKFTADDVVFTLLTIKDQNIKSPLRLSWVSTGVEKLDDYTVKFTTKEVTGPFLQNLTLPILPQSLWSKVSAPGFALAELNLKAVGTGPYAVSEIRKLLSGKVQSMTLTSFSDYYAGKPKIDSITIKFYDQPSELINALHSRDIQGFGFLPFDEDLYLDPRREDVNIYQLPLPQYQALFFNYSNKVLAQNNVRAALSAIIPKAEILRTAWKQKAKPVGSIFDFYSGEPTGGIPAPDFEKAKNLLEAAGFGKNPASGLWGKNSQPLEFKLLTNDFLPNARAAETLAEAFRNFGLRITLNILPGKQLIENHIKPRDFDLLLYGQKFGADPEPFAFLHSSQIKDPGLNLSGFMDSEADKLLTSARATTDQNSRLEKFKQLGSLLKDRIPAVYLAQTVYTYALDKNIKGFSITKLYDPANRFYDAPNWYVMEERVFK